MLTLKGQLTGLLTAQGHLSGRLAVSQGVSGILSPRLNGQLTGTLTEQSRLNGRLAVAQGMSGMLSPRLNASHYHGSYEFVPSETDTTVHTSGQILSDDIVIKAIPSNYGKISWDGSTLTVS